MTVILPSIASADLLDLRGELKKLKGTPFVHIDIEDGNFLPNITFGLKTVNGIVDDPEYLYDIHILAYHPKYYIEKIRKEHVQAICFHIETSEYPLEELNLIRSYGLKSGLAFNFKTDIRQALPFLDSLDYVLIMTAEPDLLCDRYNPHILSKIREARKLLPETVAIYVDGGIGEEELKEVLEAGADHVVMGRAIWKDPQPDEAIRRYQSMCKED